jgi:hypothetical protein
MRQPRSGVRAGVRYAVWIRSKVPDDTVEVEVVGTYIAQ